MNFGEILSKSWKTVWKFKILWIFGILSSCGQGGGGGGGGGGNSGYRFSQGEMDVPPEFRQFFFGIENFFNQIQAWQIVFLIIGFFLFILLLAFIFTALNTVGRIGLIQGAVKAEGDPERLTFGELFNSGKPFFWRIFGFNLLAGIAILLIVLLLLFPLIGFSFLTLGLGFLCIIPLLCALIPISWLVSVILEQANIAIVVEDLSIIDGVKRGWKIFRDNIGNMIVMGLILVFGGWIIGLILAFPILIVLVPAAIGLFSGMASGSGYLFGGGIGVSILCLVTYLPVLILLGGILQAYIKTAWTLTYLQLTGESSGEMEMDLGAAELEDVS